MELLEASLLADALSFFSYFSAHSSGTVVANGKS